MNHGDIDLFTTALRTRWFRILTRKLKGKPVHENWIHALNAWLEEHQLQASDLPALGHRDIARLGRLLQGRNCPFWGENLTRYAPVIRIFEEQTDNPTSLPIFGGLLQQVATKSGNSPVLSALGPNPIYTFISVSYTHLTLPTNREV